MTDTSQTKDDLVITFNDKLGMSTVYKLGVFPETSVMAGHESRTLIDAFITLEEAVENYPQAIILEEHFDADGLPVYGDTIPDWFDPSYAGEVWDED